MKGAYWHDQVIRFDREERLWKILWKLRFHKPHKILLWRIIRGYLPTMDCLHRVIGAGDMKCVMCGLGNESAVHHLRSVW